MKNTKISSFLFICFIFILFISCKSTSDPEYNQGRFSIYLLKDENTTTVQAEQLDLEDLELADKPWLTTEEIEYYEFSTHKIKLKKDKTNWPEYTEVSLEGNPFVIIAGNSRIYLGSFWNLASSMFSCTPRIEIPNFLGENQMQIKVAAHSELNPDFVDLRNDIRIKQALMRFGIYKE